MFAARLDQRFGWLLVALCVACQVSTAARGTEGWLPEKSIVGALQPGERLHLVSAMEAGSPIEPGGWNMQATAWAIARREISPRLGRNAITFRGEAGEPGKGDFRIRNEVPGELLALGAWFHVQQNANVREVGFQVYDQEGEALLYLAPVHDVGWRWVEAPLNKAAWKQAYPQAEMNTVPDMPLKSVNIIWWSQGAGRSEITVDGVAARLRPTQTAAPTTGAIEFLAGVDAQPGSPYGGSLYLENSSDNAVVATIDILLQRDGALFDEPLPDPVRGSDLARTAKSWTVANGQVIAENTLTDGLDYTAAETTFRTSYWDSADQFLAFDQPRRITSLGWRAGDANWIWKVDVLTSLDGRTFTPVADLQGVDLHKKWNEQLFPAFQPFRARVIQLHYHRDGAKMDVVRMPAALHVWDGTDDETFDIPQTGEVLHRQTLQQTIPAAAFEVVNFESPATLDVGQYLLAGKVRQNGVTTLFARHVFVEPPALENIGPHSRFGVNGSQASLAVEHRKLGVGWVRFENFKWPFVSPAPHQYAFDGSVRPWVVNLDQITREYRNAGLNILPMMFLTPQWASGDAAHSAGEMTLAQPPKNDADFGEFVFQSVARYGGQTVAPALLKTGDKKSGLGRIAYFELGNEPNLNPLRDTSRPPTWGPWSGTMDQWWTMWRHGAEAVKRADPEASVVSPGFAGATSEIVDALRRFKYTDGKCPLDWTDVISVHFYSGRTPPEIATGDVNNAQGCDVSFAEHLTRLVEWRDQHKPSVPIWMTETGYDTGGPIGANERTQAARLPRVVALCLAQGIDKVMVYRESGSTPTQHAAAGLMRNDLTRRPSWYTYATLIRQLQDAEPGRRLTHEDPNIWLQTWKRNGQIMLMAYCVTGTGRLGLDLGAATVIDAFGHVSKVDSTRELALNEFPCYLTNLENETVLAPLLQRAEQRDLDRAQQRAADARRTVYLFNFGDANEPAALDIGGLRYYQVVPADTRYDGQRGFGFVGASGVKNDFRHWMPNTIERYAVQIGKDQAFQFDVAPGQYNLRVNAVATHGASRLRLEGAAEGPISWEFNPGHEKETQQHVITASGPSLQLHAEGSHLLRWLVLEQIP